MIEVAPGLFQWARFNEEKQLHFNGHCLIHPEGNVLIDPPEPEAPLQEWVAGQGVAHVLLTNRHHARAAETFRERTGARVWMHAADADGAPLPIDETFADGATLPGGWLAITVPDSKSPGETALWAEAGGGTLVIGDARIGRTPGILEMLPDEKFPDPTRAREGIRVLLARPFTRLLLGDGTSLLAGGRAALERFCNQG